MAFMYKKDILGVIRRQKLKAGDGEVFFVLASREIALEPELDFSCKR